MDKELQGGFYKSLMIHLLVFMILSGGIKGCGRMGGGGSGNADKGEKEKQKQEEQQKIKEIKKGEPVEVELVPMPKKALTKKEKRKKTAHEDVQCSLYYGGLGIYESVIDGKTVVAKAVPGYPGYEAGLEFGDIILEPEHDKIKGEIGTEVTLTVKKFSTQEIETITIVRDKICLEEGNP